MQVLKGLSGLSKCPGRGGTEKREKEKEGTENSRT